MENTSRPSGRTSPGNIHADAVARLAEIRLVLDAFDWGHDDRQYALEQIDDIVHRDALAGAAPEPAPRLRRTGSGPEPPQGVCCWRAVYDNNTGWSCFKHGDRT